MFHRKKFVTIPASADNESLTTQDKTKQESAVQYVDQNYKYQKISLIKEIVNLWHQNKDRFLAELFCNTAEQACQEEIINV